VIVLDTNVISEVLSPSPSESVMNWLARQGRPVALGDALIAGTCLAREHSLATRNTRDFAGSGVHIVNPWGSAHD
jgi:predicted nucleic acid-binding protein